MVARPEELVQGLYSQDAATRLRAIREVKNQIIGNKTKKLSYVKLGVVPRVVELLASDAEQDTLKVQSAAAVGSFAYGVEDGLKAVVDSGGLTSLVQALFSPDEHVVQAAVRSLKMIYQSTTLPDGDALGPSGISRLVGLLAAHNRTVAEGAAVLLARATTDNAQVAGQVVQQSGVQPLVDLLLSKDPCAEEAAADALAQCCCADTQAAELVARNTAAVSALHHLSGSPRPPVQFLACKALTALLPLLPDQLTAQGLRPKFIAHRILRVVVKLLDDRSVPGNVPSVLHQLVQREPELQLAATDADAVTKLARFVLDGFLHKESALQAISVLCMPNDRDDGRKQLIDANLLPPIVRTLQDPSASMRAAACSCLRALTRSVKYLNSNLFEVDMALQLLKLLSDECLEVQVMASAALTNMVLHFSSVREGLLKHKGISSLVQLLRSMDSNLRLNGVWALQNLLYGPDAALRESVIEELPWADCRSLMEDQLPGVQEKALCLLRNLLYDSPEIIQKVLAWTEGELLTVVRDKLQLSRPYTDATRMQALYILVNIAAGNDAQQDLIMSSDLPTILKGFLQSPNTDVRVAVLWIIINLTYISRDNADPSKAAARVARLKELQVEEAVKQLRDDNDLNVKERVKTVLDQMRGGTGGGEPGGSAAANANAGALEAANMAAVERRVAEAARVFRLVERANMQDD